MNAALTILATGLLACLFSPSAHTQTTTLTEQQKLLASVGQAEEVFGEDVAAHGDVMVVGTCGSHPAPDSDTCSARSVAAGWNSRS